MIALVPLLLTVRPAFLRADDARPELSGPEEQVDLGRFLIHFTREGVDAPPALDADGNELPDLVDVMGQALVDAEQAYLDEGWRPLIGDQGVAGSDALDVYIRDLPVYGYATPWPAGDGTESCMLELDAEVSLAGSIARSVATHELHHCVEFRYSVTAETWLYESAATYEQYTHVVDPVLDVAVGVLYKERLEAPQRRLQAWDGRFEYAGFVWMKFWSELDGFDADRLPALWEALAVAPTGFEGLDAEASRVFGMDLADTFLVHAVWNSFACAGDDGAHYADDVLPCVLDVSSPIEPWDGSPVEVDHAQSPYTSAYFALPVSGGEVALTCDGDDGLRFAAVAVDAGGKGRELVTGTSGETLVVPTVIGGIVRLVVAGTDAPLSATCRQVEPPAATGGGCGCGTGPSPGWGLVLVALGVRRRR